MPEASSDTMLCNQVGGNKKTRSPVIDNPKLASRSAARLPSLGIWEIFHCLPSSKDKILSTKAWNWTPTDVAPRRQLTTKLESDSSQRWRRGKPASKAACIPKKTAYNSAKLLDFDPRWTLKPISNCPKCDLKMPPAAAEPEEAAPSEWNFTYGDIGLHQDTSAIWGALGRGTGVFSQLNSWPITAPKGGRLILGITSVNSDIRHLPILTILGFLPTVLTPLRSCHSCWGAIKNNAPTAWNPLWLQSWLSISQIMGPEKGSVRGTPNCWNNHLQKPITNKQSNRIW